jgi:hypothetical protein
MKRCIIAVAAATVLILLAVVVPAPAGEPQGKADDAHAAQLEALQAERIEALNKVVTLTIAGYEQGTSDIDAVLSAQNQLIEAELESADEPAKRVALLTRQLGMVDRLLKVAEAKRAAGTGTEVAVYQGKSLQLKVKIKLLRERNRCKPSTPQSSLHGGKIGPAKLPSPPPFPQPDAPKR